MSAILMAVWALGYVASLLLMEVDGAWYEVRRWRIVRDAVVLVALWPVLVLLYAGITAYEWLEDLRLHVVRGD